MRCSTHPNKTKKWYSRPLRIHRYYNFCLYFVIDSMRHHTQVRMRTYDNLRAGLLACFGFWLIADLQATGDSTRYLLPHDTLFLEIHYGQMVTTHTVEQGQTLFSLAKFYGLTTEEIKYYNPGMGDRLSILQDVQIPVPTKAIMRVKPDTFYRWAYAPLFYRIRPGDTLYGLSKRFFKMPMDTVRQRLDHFDGTLRTGQLYFVGWISTSGIPRALREELVHPLFRQNYALEKYIIQYVAEGKRKKEVSGAAFWEEGKDDQHFFALHNEAPIDSYIRIYNPMKKRHIFAKVIGRLPRSTPPNVQIYLTSRCAKLLGARDPQFFVEIEYYQ